MLSRKRRVRTALKQLGRKADAEDRRKVRKATVVAVRMERKAEEDEQAHRL